MLYWILLAYLIVGYFYPAVGLIALICMIGPVATSVFKGRYWCGHICPRGSYYDRLIGKVSRNREIPAFLRSRGFRGFMLVLIFAMFGVQMYYAWGDWGAMGHVFWNIIFVTTVVGSAFSIVYAPRTWCSFCPMGTLSAMVAPRRHKRTFRNIHVADDACILCKRCAKACPMQLKPYEAKGAGAGLLDTDCIKCGKCVERCPKEAMEMRKINTAEA